jgi:cation/acetate symporter
LNTLALRGGGVAGRLHLEQNIAFMVSLAFATHRPQFPVLFMSVLWKDLAPRAALWIGGLGLFSVG